MFGNLFTKEEIKEPDVMKIATELASQEYDIRFGREFIGVIRLDRNKWVFVPTSFSVHNFTEGEMHKIYFRLKQLNAQIA